MPRRRRIIVPFHVWTLFCSLSLSSSCKNEQLYIATGQVLKDRRSTEPVSGGEWASSRRRDGGCCKIWNRCCTNRMGAVAFQFGQISRTIFLNITKTNYPGPWCMFLLLWKTIKLYKWFMPFHAAIFSLWISKVPPPSLCLKQWHLCSENLLDAFPVNPLTMFLYKQVFERTRIKQISMQTSSERLRWGAGLVMITIATIFVVWRGSTRLELLHRGLWELACLRRASQKPDLWLQVICLVICIWVSPVALHVPLLSWLRVKVSTQQEDKEI